MSIITTRGALRSKLSKHHIIHFPFNETEGNEMIDICSLSTIEQVATAGPTFLVPNAITFGAGNYNWSPDNAWNVTRGKRLFNKGSFLFYMSCRVFTEVEHVVGSVKAGFGHFEPFARVIFDIQRSIGETKTTIKLRSIPSSAAEVSTITLDGADTLLGKDIAIACVATIGENDWQFHQHDKNVINKTALNAPTVFDFRQIPETQAGAPVPEYFDYGPKNIDAYEMGGYIFPPGELPTDNEIQTFLNWLYIESRAGNKDPYIF